MIGQAQGSEVLHVSSVQESEGTVRVNAGVYRELAVREHKRFRLSRRKNVTLLAKSSFAFHHVLTGMLEILVVDVNSL